MADWCQDHPRYSARRPPRSLCGRCWQLWFYTNPEDGRRNDKERVVDHAYNKDLRDV